MMYWHIGERINREVLDNQRAEYGKQIVSAVSTQLQAEYGKKGFEPRSIWRMMQFAQEFPDEQIVAQAARQLSWSHFIEVLPLKDDLQREFYITMADVVIRRKRLKKNAEEGLISEKQLESLSLSIYQLGFNSRLCSALRVRDFYTLGDIVKCSRSSFLRYRNIGAKGMAEIDKAVADAGLTYDFKI